MKPFSRLAVVLCLCFVLPLQSCQSAEPLTNLSSEPMHTNAWLEIDTVQFERNVSYLQQLMGRTRVCVVMKGDAYGNGISLLMPTLLKRGIQQIAITSNREARDVRDGGFTGHLMRIRTATLDEVTEGLPLGIEELVGNLRLAQQMDSIAARYGQTIAYHLAVNAGGMSRGGMELSTAAQLQEGLAILRLPHLRVVGMMTHYPTSHDAEIRAQLATFQRQTDYLIREAGLDRSKLLLHTAATYAALFVPETRLDMVRVGSALYNFGFPRYTRFKKIMSFKSRVASINTYPKGRTVSYKRTRTLGRNSRLASIPIGYANGFSTAFSNKGFMLIRGHRVPVVGGVTMNITVVDVTDYPDIQPGDEVVVYGRQQAEEITAEEITRISGTNLLSQSLFWAAANPKIAVGGE